MPASPTEARRAQRDRHALERRAVGDGWRESGFVFTNSIGGPLVPSNVLKQFKRHITAMSHQRIEGAFRASKGISAGAVLAVEHAKEFAPIQVGQDHPLAVANRIQEQRFHDLWHAAASRLLVQGVPVRVVMDILGHSQMATTMDL